MYFESYKSHPPQSPYAPEWDFKIGESYIDDIDIKSLSKFLLSKEKEIKKLPKTFLKNGKVVDGYTGLGSKSVTSKFNYYNLLEFDHPEILKLKKTIFKSVIEYNTYCGIETPNDIWIQCWYNVLRFGQKINSHSHSFTSNCYLSGHFNVQVKKTLTCYNIVPVDPLNDPYVTCFKNRESYITLFPSYIFHYTTRHLSFAPRITIAFDLSLTKKHNYICL
jgi:hypothetical protein